MKCRIDGSDIVINSFSFFETILDSLSDNDRKKFLESYACDSEVIKHVTSQILDGWTENLCHGSTCVHVPPQPIYGLDYAWREVAKRSSEVAKKEIERLEKRVHELEEQNNLLSEQNTRLVKRLTVSSF